VVRWLVGDVVGYGKHVFCAGVCDAGVPDCKGSGLLSDTWSSGWLKFPYDPVLAAWVEAAKIAADAAVANPEMQRKWLQCEGTWFVGVDALPNDASGAVHGSQGLTGAAMTFIDRYLEEWPPLHPAQVSVIYPGYPKPRMGESEAAFRFRKNRDAAHIDGILPHGSARRRKLVEPHAFILGIPLNDCAADAGPLVVWPDSPDIIRRHLSLAFSEVDPAKWADLDITKTYQAARQEVFATCQRLELSAKPGEAYLLHRLALHGVAPWRTRPEGRRMVAYFRPPWQGTLQKFLSK
jgi:hypothetical protein